MADRSQWDSHFGSGLKEEYDFTIYTASFTTDLRYNNGNSYVLLLVGVDEEGEPTEEMLSVGADWESIDGGRTLTHPRKAGSINRNSAYGKWCAFAAEACEKSNSDFIFDKDPKDAFIWVNTKWRLKEKKVGEEFTNKQTNEKVAARFRLVPDEFLGVEADDAPVSASQSPSPAPVASSPAPKTDPAAVVAASRLRAAQAATATSPVRDRLLAMVASSPDFDTFLAAATADDEVLADDVLVESLVDSGPSGFYAQNKK